MRAILVAALIAAIALGGCGGSAPEAPPPQAPPSPEQKKALDRADALIADMKKRQAALEQSDRAFAGKGGKAPSPAVVEPTPAPAQPRPATRETAPITQPTQSTQPAPPAPPTPPQAPPGRGPVNVLTSSYTVVERGKAFWRFSWKASVRNQERRPVRVRAEMYFKDANGVLISTGEQTLTINGGAAADVTGVVSIKATDGPRVASATPRMLRLQ